MTRACVLFICLAIISACTTVNIDEAFVFRPQTGIEVAETEEDLTIQWEDVFSDMGAISIELQAWKQTANIMFARGEIAKADVEHGFISADDMRIAYTLISREDSSRPLIVHCGGNTASRYDSGTPYGLKLITFGDAFLFDYPGYGDSPGQAGPETLRQMNHAVAKYAEALVQSGRPIILWGHSLGGFVCTDMISAFKRVDGLILETSARNAAVVAETVPPWFVKPFIRIKIAETLTQFDNVTALEGFEAPVLVLGARKDLTLPVRLSRELAKDLKQAGQNVTYEEFAEANHISVATVDRFPVVIEAFMRKIRHHSAQIASLQEIDF